MKKLRDGWTIMPEECITRSLLITKAYPTWQFPFRRFLRRLGLIECARPMYKRIGDGPWVNIQGSDEERELRKKGF